jgi:glycosyltransferase involved in cell wall biosynthesis
MSEPIKLLHVLYSGQGGLGTYFMELVASDENRRFAHQAVFYGVEAVHPEYQRFARQKNVPFVAIRKHRGPDPIATLRLLAAISQRADVIVVHTGAAAACSLIRASVSNCILIHIEHTPTEVKTKREQLWSKLLRSSSDRTVLFYPGHLDELTPRPSASEAARFVIIPKSPDIDFFRPVEEVHTDGGIRIGMQGRLSANKDHATLLRAFAIASARSEVPWTLHLAGGGEEEQRLRRLANQLGISSATTFHGRLERDALLTMLQSLDIYAHATPGETMCYALMEAQACGLPVVASDVRGVRDAIEAEVTGLLYHHGDPQAFADRLLALAGDSQFRQQLGRNARASMIRRAKAHPTAEAYHELVLDIQKERGCLRDA